MTRSASSASTRIGDSRATSSARDTAGHCRQPGIKVSNVRKGSVSQAASGEEKTDTSAPNPLPSNLPLPSWVSAKPCWTLLQLWLQAAQPRCA